MLKARVLTAAVLLAAFLAALFLLPAAGWVVLVAAVIGLAASEWAALCALSGPGRWLYAAAVAAVAAVAAGGFAGAAALDSTLVAAAASFWLLAAPFWLRFWQRVRPGAVWAAAGAVLLPAAAVAAVQLREAGPGTLLAILAVVWIADSAAYFAGRAFGRRKLAPAISPGKTWEGVAGAMAAAAAFALALTAAAGDAASFAGRWLSFTLAVVVLVAVSIVGDLFESALKRRAGVKDSGALLPGHGGVLDRIDSLLAALPVAAVLVAAARGSAAAP